MAIRPRLLLVGFAFGGLVACASIAGLEDSDPSVDATTPAPDADGGPTGHPVGDGSITTEAGVTITPTSIDFQRSVCGTQQSIQINITNAGETATTFSVTMPPSETFALEGADGNGAVTGPLAARAIASVTLKANSSKPGITSADVSVVVGTETTTLNAKLETRGAGIVFDPPAVDFGSIRENVPSSDTMVTVRNDGNDPITIQSFGNAADFATPKDVTIAPGTSTSQPFKLNGGPAGGLLTENALPITSGEHCGPIPTLSLKGQRVNTNVLVSAAQLEFGSPVCNVAASSVPLQNVVITNYSTIAGAKFTVKPQGGSRFTYSTLTGNIPLAPSATNPSTGTVQIGIGSIGATPEDVTENLVITTEGAETKDWPVKLHFKVTGAVVSLGKSEVSLKDRTYTDVPISNSGNVTVCVDYSSDNSQVDIYEGNNDHSDRLNPGDKSQRLTVAFFNGSSTDNDGNVTIKPISCGQGQPAAVVCNSMPSLIVRGKP